TRTSAFEGRAIPVPEVCRRFVRALAEIEDVRFRRIPRSHIVVLQDKVAQLGVPLRGSRTNWRGSKSLWARSGIGIECRVREPPVPRPEAAAAHLMRIPFTRDGIRSWIHRSGTA